MTEIDDIKKRMQQYEREAEFRHSNNENLESVEEILNDTLEHDQYELRERIVKEFELSIRDLNVEKLKYLSNRLINNSNELKAIKSIVSEDIEKYSKYYAIINSTINDGIESLKAMNEELKKSGLLEFLEIYSLTGKLYASGLSNSDLPITEKELIERFSLSKRETKKIQKIVSAIIRGRVTEYQDEELFEDNYIISKALDQSIEFISNFSKAERSNLESKVTFISGSSKIFFGTGLISMNIGGFLSTLGLIISAENSIVSNINGLAFILDGGKEIISSKINLTS